MRPFFFSYAHNDALDAGVDNFFELLNIRARMLCGTKKDGYRDTQKVRLGEKWSEELVDALRDTPALVCLYSPSYFNSTVCAQELQVFLERRQQYVRQNPEKKTPASIIPVLWQPTDIPRTLPDLHYAKPQSPKLEKEGVWRVHDAGEEKEFRDIALDVATRVKEAVKLPLPELSYKPVLGGVGSAFEPPPLPPAEFDQDCDVAGPRCATFVYAKLPAWQVWPFAPDHEPLLHIAGQVVKGRDLHFRQLTFDPAADDLLRRLTEARKRNNLTIFLLIGTQLADPRLREQLSKCDLNFPDLLGALTVWPNGSPDPGTQDYFKEAFPSLSRRQAPIFYRSLESPDKFATSVGKCLDALRTAVRKNLSRDEGISGNTEYTGLPPVSSTAEEAA